MRKLIIFTIIFLFLSACGGNNQNNAVQSENKTVQQIIKDTLIQKEILDVVLGKTSKDSALEILAKQGYNLGQIDRDGYVYDKPIRFGGVVWSAMGLYTYKNKVRKICFVQYDENPEILLNEFNNVGEVLMEKYKPLYFSDTAEEPGSNYNYLFMDRESTLSFRLNISESKEIFLEMSYEDLLLEDEYNQNAYDEF